MPYKLVAPKAGRWAHWRVRGTENGVYVDRSTKVGDRKVAQRILAEWKAEAQRQAIAGPQKRTTFAEAAIAYMNAGGERRFLAPLLKHIGNMALTEIGQSEIDAAAATLYPCASPATRNRQVYSPLSAILKRAGIEKHFKRPKGAQGTPRLTWLRPEEAMRLLDAAEAVDARFGALCCFLLYTGCRLSEALRLKWSDVNLEERFAYVRDTKNGEDQPVHLTEAVAASLGNLRTQWRRGNAFSLTKCGRLYKLFDATLAKAEIELPPRTAFHVLRHTWGTWMRRYAGLDVPGLLATKRWKSAQSVQGYVHTIASEEARKADLLPVRKK